MLAFPSTYAVGITSLGFQTVWATLATRPDVDVRRLFTDRSDPPHRHCDLFGLSLSWELDGPVLLDLLEGQGIPLWSEQRGESDPIVFGGGPVLTANPEPLAPFFDVVLLGDGELLLPAFLDALLEHRRAPRGERLRALCRVPGVYVPSLYTPCYSAAGDLLGVEPIEAGIPTSVGKQTWRGNTLTHSMVITPEAAWPSIHMVEVARSCPELCRFCLASYLTLPFRTASLDDGLIPAVEKGLAVTPRLGLLGASVTQHPQFGELLGWLDQDRFDHIRVSVSSVRAATVTPELGRILARRGSRSLTIAIESGSERMRRVVNKKLAQEEIFAAARHVRAGGLSALKLYGMVGLPSEEEADVEATADLLLCLRKATPGLRLSLGVSTFVPKAHTPFQWEGVRPEAEKRLRLLAKRLRPKGIDLRPESYGWSVIQALLSRSDRRLAPVIAAVRARPESLGSWKQAYRSARSPGNGSDPVAAGHQPPPPPWEEVVHATWDEARHLPWNHLQGPLPRQTLLAHRAEALATNPTGWGLPRGAVAAQPRQKHPARHIDAAVIGGHIGGVQAEENQGGDPPGPLEGGVDGHAPADGPEQQPEHEAHHQQRHRDAVTHGQIDRQVVGMAMPEPCAQGIDHAEGGGSPAEPGSFGDQLQGHPPLGQSGDRQGALAGILQIGEATPDRFRHQKPGRFLKNSRHPGQAGHTDQAEHNGEQRQQPSPAGPSGNQGQGEDQGTPGVAGIGEQQGPHQGDDDQQHQGAMQATEPGLLQGGQGERPDQGKPGTGDVGVIEQP